jgi:2-dehydro-3-deoxygluconokinase
MGENFPQLKTIVSTARFDANASSNGISAVYGRKEMFESKNYNISHIIDRIGAEVMLYGGYYLWNDPMA